jgi:hypothetical protein
MLLAVTSPCYDCQCGDVGSFLDARQRNISALSCSGSAAPSGLEEWPVSPWWSQAAEIEANA